MRVRPVVRDAEGSEVGRAITEGALHLRPAPLLVRLAFLAVGLALSHRLLGALQWKMVGGAILGFFLPALSASLAPLIFGGGRLEVSREGIVVSLRYPSVWRGALAALEFSLLYLVQAVWGPAVGGVLWCASWVGMFLLQRGNLMPLFEAAKNVASTAGGVWCAVLSLLAFLPLLSPLLPSKALLWMRVAQGVGLLSLLEARWAGLR